MAVSERKKLVKELDTVFGDYIKMRDGNKCVICGSDKMPQPGHLFTRAAYSTRWSELNTHCQCRTCNFRHEHDPYPYINFFLRKYGETAFHELHRQHVTPVKYHNWELQEKIEYWREKCEEFSSTSPIRSSAR